MKVKLISHTIGVNGESPQEIISYCARVSNPGNQSNFASAHKLLKYCFKHGHLSIFEQATFGFEIVTSRAIAAQILRHRHFNYQEFSQRYAEVQSFEIYEVRVQDPKNRQNSLVVEDPLLNERFGKLQEISIEQANALYKEALDLGIAKEQARFLLPMSSTTTLYMTGNVRSWIHYLAIRLGPETQKEHREVAQEIFNILTDHLPDVMMLLDDFNVYQSNPYD